MSSLYIKISYKISVIVWNKVSGPVQSTDWLNWKLSISGHLDALHRFYRVEILQFTGLKKACLFIDLHSSKFVCHKFLFKNKTFCKLQSLKKLLLYLWKKWSVTCFQQMAQVRDIDVDGVLICAVYCCIARWTTVYQCIWLHVKSIELETYRVVFPFQYFLSRKLICMLYPPVSARQESLTRSEGV